MLRERPANNQSIERTIAFLKALHDKIKAGHTKVSLHQLTIDNGIAQGSGTACLKLGYIKLISQGIYEWTYFEPVNEAQYRIMALSIKDELLTKTKKSNPPKIQPDWLQIDAKIAALESRIKYLENRVNYTI